MIEQWSFDKGTGRRAGMGTRGYTAQAELVGEAGSATAVGQLLRKGMAGQPHDKVVPVKAFQRDVVRKLRLRKVMGKKPGERQKEVLVKDKDALLPGEQFVKEQVNYRYSGDPDRSCGACVHFVAPSSCEIVAGLINRVDLCDKFEPLHQRGRGDGVIRAELIPNENTLGESRRAREGRVVQAYMAEQWDGDDDYENGGECSDDEKDADGRCPGDPDFDDATAGLYDPDLFGAGEEEVTPPGFEPVVRALKKQPGVEEPYAVAWAMKKRGIKPKAAESAARASDRELMVRAVLEVVRPREREDDGIPVGRIVRQSEGMSVMGGHSAISDVPSSPSGRYENPANRKAGGVLA